MKEKKEILYLDNPSQEELEEIIIKRKVCLIRNGMKDWNALKEWNSSYLQQIIGKDKEITTRIQNSFGEFPKKKSTTFEKFIDYWERDEKSNQFYDEFLGFFNLRQNCESLLKDIKKIVKKKNFFKKKNFSKKF